MTYANTLSRALKVLTFDETSLNELANDEKATGHGFLTLALVGLAVGLFYSIFAINPGAGIGMLIVFPIYMIIGFIIGYSIYHFLAKIFGGQATGMQYFRSLSNVMFIIIFSVIPFISYLVSIYMMFLNGFVLIKVHKLDTWKAVVVVLIPALVVAGLIIAGMAAYFSNSVVY